METSNIVVALVALGVEGPATAVDVLKAANVKISTAQKAEVLNELMRYRANERKARKE